MRRMYIGQERGIEKTVIIKPCWWKSSIYDDEK
jgi:hypothetical protein